MENSRKEPLIRIEKRSERPHGQIIRLRLLSVLLAIVAGDCSYSLSDIIHFPYTEPLYPVHLEVLWPFRQLLS